MFTELPVTIGSSGSVTLDSGKAPSTVKITLGYKPRRVWVRGNYSASPTSSANGYQCCIYDEDVSEQFLWLGNVGWSFQDQGMIWSIDDDGFSLRNGYLSLSTVFWWATP